MSKILVVEDDFNLRSNICEILSTEEYDVECAENGISGIQKVRSFAPDLIISDIMMPVMNGFDLLETLMNDPETASIPFIFLTAKAEPENFRKGMKMGADDYLYKPFNIDDLLAAVTIRLKKKSLNDQKLKMMQEQISLKLPHELRTPLVPILGYAEMMQDEEDVNQIRQMAGVIRKSGKTLHNKIEKFLLYKELILKENNRNLIQRDLKQIRISDELIARLIRKLPKELMPERINIKVENSLIPFNEMYFEVLVLELLENGLKFSGTNDEVFFRGVQDEDNYIITVTDPGRGMKEFEIQSITAFRKFGQNEFAEDGLGLGLAILKKIAELFNCKFQIKSELNKFTACEISIPLIKE